MIEFTKKGIYCSPGDFYIDPWGKVQRAVITHAHADHARTGMGSYLAHESSKALMRLRLGRNIQLETVAYNQPLYINGVKVSLHPAGHVPGSAQIRVEHKGEVWVISGDYKVENDGLSTPFEPVKCHSFISECTFGMPVFKWEDQYQIYRKINEWWLKNAADGRASVIYAYSLGKAQRILHHLNTDIGPVFVHGAVYNINEALQEDGYKLPDCLRPGKEHTKQDFRKCLVISPPSARGTPWLNKFAPYESAMASGWMALRGNKRRQALDVGFILSDHADWPGLNAAIAATGAEKVYLTHGYKAPFARFLNRKGIQAFEADTLFSSEDLDETFIFEHEADDVQLP
jgi:putative mRNA 3-end processing factor